MSGLPEVERVEVVEVKPGDVVWIRVERRLTNEHRLRIKDVAEQLWPDNKVVVGEECDVKIVRPEGV